MTAKDEAEEVTLLRRNARKHIEKMAADAWKNGCPNLAQRIESRTIELIQVLLR